MRALTYHGELVEIDKAQLVPLDLNSLDAKWRTLYLVVGEAAATAPPDTSAGQLDRSGPVLELPQLRLSARRPEHGDYFPVALVRKAAGQIELDKEYIPPCAVAEGHQVVANAAEEWRAFLDEIGTTSLTRIADWHHIPEARNIVEVLRLVWSLSKAAAFAIQERPLRVDRLFQVIGSFARDLVAIDKVWSLQRFEGDRQPRPDELTSTLENLAAPIQALKALIVLIRKAQDFPPPVPKSIRLAGDPGVTEVQKQTLWTTRLPLGKPLANLMTNSNRTILIGLNFKKNVKAEVRIHPTKQWASIEPARIVETHLNSGVVNLDTRFSQYFTFSPDETDLAASEIVFQTTTTPMVSGPDSVIITEHD